MLIFVSHKSQKIKPDLWPKYPGCEIVTERHFGCESEVGFWLCFQYVNFVICWRLL